MELLDKSGIRKSLNINKLMFEEFDSRMNYGAIGRLWEIREQEMKVLIFPKASYVKDNNFSINSQILLLIQSIQKEFAELTRDNNGKIIVFDNDEEDVIEITLLENLVLICLGNSMYAELGFSDTGFEDLLLSSNLEKNVLKGVIGSLIKKGLIAEDRREDEGYKRDSWMWVYYLTKDTQWFAKKWRSELLESGLKEVKFKIK